MITDFCEWCGKEHPPEELCHKVLSRRSFTSLVGLGLLGLGMGPHAFNAKAPMLGPRMELLDPLKQVLFSWRLQPGVFNYQTPSPGGGKFFHAVHAQIRGTRFLNDCYDVGHSSGVVIEGRGTLNLATVTEHNILRDTIPLIGLALAVPDGLYDDIGTLKQKLMSGQAFFPGAALKSWSGNATL